MELQMPTWLLMLLAEIFTYLPASKIVNESILQQIVSSKGDLAMRTFQKEVRDP